MKRNQKNKPNEVIFPVKLWETLDEMPQHNWENLGSTGNLRFLIKDSKKFLSKNVVRKTLEELYMKLLDEFFVLIGDDPDRQELIILKKQLIIANMLYVMGDNFQLNWIKIYESDIATILRRYEDIDPDEAYIHASKWLGNGMIDKTKITVRNWVKLFKTIEKESAISRQSNAKNIVNE